MFTLFLFASFAYAQVRGVVVDDFGPVAGAVVTVDETGNSTETGDDGAFSITAEVGNTLTVLNPNTLAEKKFPVTGINMGNLLVSDAATILTDVLVMGYDNTVTREESIGAQTTIGEEAFEGRPTVSFLSSVQGNSPGVMIQTSSGSPGSAKIDALIRGRSSIAASTDPLIVVDGVIMGSNQFRNLNQNDFESVSILRDAHATSIYGNRGANGVIVIKTKSGRYNQALKINLNTSYGIFTLPGNDYNIANAREMLTLQNRLGTGLGGSLTEEEIAAWDIDTNWLDVFFQEGINQQYNLTFSQGGERFNSFTSVGYMDVQGMVPTTDFQRFSVRTNINGKSLNEKFEYGMTLAPGFSKRHQLDAETRGDISANIIQNPLQGAMTALPYLESGIYQNGQQLFDAIGSNFSGGRNIYVLEDILIPGQMPNQLSEFNILGNAYVNYKFTDYITARSKINVDYKHQQRMFARAPWSYLAIVVANGAGTEFGGVEDIWNDQDVTFSNINSLHYDRTFNELHTINVGAYMEYIKAHNYYSSRRQVGLDPRTWELGAGTGYITRDGDNYIPSVNAAKVDAGSFSYFGMFDYDYNAKYGLGFNIRRDATYRFIEDKKWGTFWSVGGRWNINKEAFMEDVDVFNMLKLRASYGTQGNSNILPTPYDYNPLFVGTSVALDYNTTGTGYLNENAFYSVVGNPDIQWEVVKQWNIGLDWIMFNNKLEGNLDVYRKKTEQLYDAINVSGVNGQFAIQGNNGELENKGVELNLRYNLINKENLDLSIFGNTAYNENKILDLTTEDLTPGFTVNAIGGPVNQWYVYEYYGVNPANGNLLFLDANGNPTENPDPEADSQFTGKSSLPKWVGGFGFNSKYHGFYLDAQFSYQFDVWKYDNQLQWLYDSSPASVAGYAVSADLLDAWTPENPNTVMPSLTASNVTLQDGSDRLIMDASFIKLKNVSLGYSVPQDWLSPTFVRNMNIYVQAENLATWSNWKGLDPEGYVTTTLGVYPSPRTISFGFNVEF